MVICCSLCVNFVCCFSYKLLFVLIHRRDHVFYAVVKSVCDGCYSINRKCSKKLTSWCRGSNFIVDGSVFVEGELDIV